MTYPDNVGDSDRWQDPRDIQDGETDQPAPTPRTAEEKIVSALRMVSDLCDKRREWTMSIPARPDYDPDLVIADALYTARYELSAARAHRVDGAYLSRLASGKKADPSAETLRKLGISVRTTYSIRRMGKP